MLAAPSRYRMDARQDLRRPGILLRSPLNLPLARALLRVRLLLHAQEFHGEDSKSAR